MTEAIDLSGKRFGKLEVINRNLEEARYIQYLCKCDCGTIKLIRASNLQNGTTNSCGCLIKDIGENRFSNKLIGKKFGRLSVVSLNHKEQKYNSGKKDGYYRYWDCICECGNSVIINGAYLTGTQKTKSCGCIQKESVKEFHILSKDNPNNVFNKRKDLIKYFENIEDSYYLSVRSDKRVDCICPVCKNKKNMQMKQLSRDGFGCRYCPSHLPYGEKYISELLNSNGIEFEREKKFDWSQNKRYDFYIPKLSCIIENHGIQHYKDGFRGKYKENQKNDNYKLEKAKENGIENYITIDCRYSTMNFIKKSIEESNLIEILKINKDNVDFLKIEEVVRNGIFKDILELYDNKISARKIALKYKISVPVVYSYLRKGEELGLCSFQSKKEKSLEI